MFEGEVTSNGYQGDMALDDISVQQWNCPDTGELAVIECPIDKKCKFMRFGTTHLLICLSSARLLYEKVWILDMVISFTYLLKSVLYFYIPWGVY